MIDIVGGIYREYCDSGRWSELFGSGLRAAAAISERCSGVRLTSCVGRDDTATARAVASTFGVQTELTEVEQTVCFSYLHALAKPEIEPGRTIQADPLQLTADWVLAFGMIENEWQIVGKRVVYDPQDPVAPLSFRSRDNCRADELAIVCNGNEARLLAKNDNTEQAAQFLLKSERADAVVVKCGPLGVLVCTANGIENVPAFRTSRVWPLGSGDVFAAVFADNWAHQSKSPSEASTAASQATAYYCQTRTLPIPIELNDAFGAPLQPVSVEPKPQKLRVYLAGPFFTLMERWMIEETRSLLLHAGFDVFSPMHDVGVGSASQVVQQDLRGLEDCDVVFAILDNLDSGTLFEVGYARSREIPVIAYAENVVEESLKMLAGTDCEIYRDFVSAMYNLHWALEN